MARRARRGPLAGLLALAVVVSGVGAAWLVTGDDDVVRTARATDRASTAPEGAGPLGVSNALGAPIPGADRRPDVPRSVEDWVGRVLPVSGTVVPLVDGIAATVRIERIDESSVAVRIDDLSSPPGTRRSDSSCRRTRCPTAAPSRTPPAS